MKADFEDQKRRDATSISNYRDHIHKTKSEVAVITLLREALTSQAEYRRTLAEQDNRGVNDISALQVLHRPTTCSCGAATVSLSYGRTGRILMRVEAVRLAWRFVR